MKNELKKAKIISTGASVEVYQSKALGTWINYQDCTTEYNTNELNFESN